MKHIPDDLLKFLELEFHDEVMAAYAVKDSPEAHAVFKKRAENFERVIQLLKHLSRQLGACDGAVISSS